MKGLFIFGKPATSVIAIGSEDFHVFRLCEALSKRGWSLNTLQFPSAFHICVTLLHTDPGVAQQFIDDVRVETDKLLLDKPKPVEGMVRRKLTISWIQFGKFQEYYDSSYTLWNLTGEREQILEKKPAHIFH